MKPSRASDVLWDKAIKRTNAESGIGDPADALYEIPTIKALIKSIGTDPNALELLAARSHELTPAQRTAALKAYQPPKEPKARKATPAVPSAATRARRMANVGLYGKSGAPRT